MRGWRRALTRLTGRKIAPAQGLYLWGSVGRGKTFLMDLFYVCLPFQDKRREHFHRFMAYVHGQLRQLEHEAEPLEIMEQRVSPRGLSVETARHEHVLVQAVPDARNQYPV